MSSTSAVAVLAQGLRELRDFAEGPDGDELRERTGLSGEQIEAALGGEQLPTREVTLALVGAWEGDVEAWREYWGQISELAKAEEEEEEGGERERVERDGRKVATTPAPPEPSVIIPRAVETDGGEDRGPEADAGDGGAGAGVEAEAAVQEAEVPAEAESDAETAKVERAARAEGDAASGSDRAGRAAGGSGAAVEAEAAGSAAIGVGAAGSRARKSVAARTGIPVLLFAVGVGVGAFGDHALSTKQTSDSVAASVPPVSSSAPSHAPRSSAPSSGASSSVPSTPTSSVSTNPTAMASTGGSASSSSTVAPGTVLGAYVNIQLASGYSVNFLSDPYHPAAGTANGPDTMGFFASSFVDGRFYADRVAVLDPTDTGSYTSCLNDTRYQHDVLLSQVSTGSSFCVTTGTGHLVLVTVRRMPSSTDANPYADLDVTVWQGAG